jgi:NAD(P)-dependent dehydrogenase (short-subunit alcohol dehydrogenase family)
MSLNGRGAVVTGGGRGIGRAVARALAEEGAAVVVSARSTQEIEAVAAELVANGHTAHAVTCDVADEASVKSLAEAAAKLLGTVDVLVNNAGIAPTSGAVQDWTREELEQIYRVNLISPAELCRQAIPRMVRRGRGHIVNISSLAGTAVFPGLTGYSSTKAGLTQFTAGLRADLKKLPIGTTVVELGPIPTDMLDSADDYKPTADSFRRLYRLQLLTDVSKETVADDVVEAVEQGRRHVRHPKRAIAFALLAEAPRRTVEILLTGVKPRPR